MAVHFPSPQTTPRTPSLPRSGGTLLLAYASLCQDWARVVALHFERRDQHAALKVTKTMQLSLQLLLILARCALTSFIPSLLLS